MMLGSLSEGVVSTVYAEPRAVSSKEARRMKELFFMEGETGVISTGLQLY
jgi:hypothetical protein